jgi:hypothetical protein
MQTLHSTRFRISSMCFWNVERRGVLGIGALCRESAAAIPETARRQMSGAEDEGGKLAQLGGKNEVRT